MYESYSKQALPDKLYRELIGSALCVFNANNQFVIENILRFDETRNINWRSLIDKSSTAVKDIISETIISEDCNEIQDLFYEIIKMRNRIIHSFQITIDDKQMLGTKEKEKDGGKIFVIDENYLMKFIKLNEILSEKLHDLRGF